VDNIKTEEQSWLYSTSKLQEITIKCENKVENKIILNKIGKLSVSRKYKITPHVTLRTQESHKKSRRDHSSLSTKI